MAASSLIAALHAVHPVGCRTSAASASALGTARFILVAVEIIERLWGRVRGESSAADARPFRAAGVSRRATPTLADTASRPG
jgi:hypothetical protein